MQDLNEKLEEIEARGSLGARIIKAQEEEEGELLEKFMMDQPNLWPILFFGQNSVKDLLIKMCKRLKNWTI